MISKTKKDLHLPMSIENLILEKILLRVSKIRTAMSALSDRKSIATDVARTLGITTATLYKHVNADGTLKAAGQKILNENQ